MEHDEGIIYIYIRTYIRTYKSIISLVDDNTYYMCNDWAALAASHWLPGHPTGAWQCGGSILGV